ncbi:MAG: spermidine synthase [Hyphomicrobiales bacterium]|nr:spermidine synthase [Hyphomicrobiales bacterium]
MIPWRTIDAAEIPGGGGRLRLMRRGDEFSIRLEGNELMNSRLSGSEEALAALTCEPLEGRSGVCILIGGLGMGFTLRAALAALAADAEVVVAELVPAVIAWAKGPMSEVFRGCVDDARVDLREADVGAVITERTTRYDAILLDVDNGPDGLTRQANDALYSANGLRAAYAALRPGGVLAVWSSGPDPAFTKRLRNAGFVVEEKSARARGKSGGARHVIWLAARPPRAA